jgi:hypothetical protein
VTDARHQRALDLAEQENPRRVVALYEDWGRPGQAEEWRAR